MIINIILILIISRTTSATTYYVAKNGSNSNPGTESQPWKTIANANSTLVPGDTVYIKAGIYNEQIRPTNNGSSGNYIVYKNYKNDKVVIYGQQKGADLKNRAYIIIDGLIFQNCKRSFFLGEGAHHNIIQNNHSKNGGWNNIQIGDFYNQASPDNPTHHNKILNNIFEGSDGDVIGIGYNAHYNLIEGNEIRNGSHGAIVSRGCAGAKDAAAGKKNMYNIIRNNIVHNEWWTNLNIQMNSWHTLIEGNIIYDCGIDIGNNPKWPKQPSGTGSLGIQHSTPESIIRNNVIYGASGSGLGLSTYGLDVLNNQSIHNRIYNNVIYNNGTFGSQRFGVKIVNLAGHRPEDQGILQDNILINNIIYKNKDGVFFYDGKDAEKFAIWRSNNMIGTAPGQVIAKWRGNRTLSWLESNYPALFINNVEVDPLFADESTHNFHLQPNSPMIDAGTFLTKTISAGSGKKIKVKDALYFSDGFGLIEGDLIQLESQTERARITKVDYDNNIITIDRNLIWHSGQGVSLPYNGSAPDIGAYEYQGTTQLSANPNASPTSGQVPLTVNFTGNATGGTPPYGYSWNFGDGESSSEKNPTHTYSAVGSYTVTLTVTDSENNQNNDSVTINAFVDTTPPTGTIIINNGEAKTHSTSVTLTLSATDDQSGMGPGAEMKFSNDNVTWSNPVQYATSADWILASGEGVKTVYAKFKDVAGNWMPTSAIDEITLDTSATAYLIHDTFEQGNDGWGNAIGRTGYENDDSTSYAGRYSLHVYATGANSKLSVGTNPSGWDIDQFPYLSFAYKIPRDVPVGVFFNTDTGWICLGGSRMRNSGGYSTNNVYILNDDNSWHIITLNVKDKIRKVYPSAKNILKFEWYTQNNGKQGDGFWVDEVMVFSDSLSSKDIIPPHPPREVKIH